MCVNKSKMLKIFHKDEEPEIGFYSVQELYISLIQTVSNGEIDIYPSCIFFIWFGPSLSAQKVIILFFYWMICNIVLKNIIHFVFLDSKFNYLDHSTSLFNVLRPFYLAKEALTVKIPCHSSNIGTREVTHFSSC